MVLSLSTGSAFAADSAAPKVTRAELEIELSDLHKASILRVLKAMDPTRDYAALVQVTIPPNADLSPLTAEDPNDYLPGTLRERAESARERRKGLLLGLPQKKSVMVMLPSDADVSIKEPAITWIRRELRMPASEPVDFQAQGEARKAPAGEKPDPTVVPEPPFIGSKLFWIAMIIAGTFLASIILLLIGRVRANKKGDPIVKMLPAFIQPPEVREEKAKEEKKKADDEAKAAAEEPLGSMGEELAAIERICRHDLEISSLAFGNLVSRADQLQLASGIVQGFGIEKALVLFPKANGTVWAKVGDSIASEAEAEAPAAEGARAFRRAFSAEVARLQGGKDQVRLLPQMETLSGAEIARRIKASGAAQGGATLALLSESAVSSVVPKLSTNELFTFLQSMLNTPSILQSDLEKLDRGDFAGGSADQVVEIDGARKTAIALSTLPAASEFATFAKLLGTRGERLISEIAPYRLMPMHLHFLPPQMISEVVQNRELDELKQMLMAVPNELRGKLLDTMTERQRAVAEDGGEPSEHDAEILRTFLADLHSRNFMGQPHRVAEIFGSRKVA
jgi:hypothetical protein